MQKKYHWINTILTRIVQYDFDKNCKNCTVLEEAKSRYVYSSYILDPNKQKFSIEYSQSKLKKKKELFSYHNKWASVKTWFVVFCCAARTTIYIKVMKDYSSSAFLQEFTRFSCDSSHENLGYLKCLLTDGYPKCLLTDEGSQIVKGCESMKFDFCDIKWKLHAIIGMEFERCPFDGHNMKGLVERKIREIKASMAKTILHRLSIMQYKRHFQRSSWSSRTRWFGWSLNSQSFAMWSK